MIFVTVGTLTKYDRSRNLTDIRAIGNLSWDVSSEEEAYKECVTAPTVMAPILDGWSLTGIVCVELKPETLLQDKDTLKFIEEHLMKVASQSAQPEGEVKE